jgi:hypothetical protein
MIAFGRIVQYQSVIFLVSVVVILLLYRLWVSPQRLAGVLALAGWTWAGGLLAHFEALGILLPALLLLGAIGLRAGWRRLALALLPALGIAAVTAVIFYIPYLRYPGFETAYAYVANERLGLRYPYNNLVDFLQRTMLYSSSYYVMALIAGTLLGLGLLYRRQFGTFIGVAAAAITALLAAVALLRPAWVTVGESDLSGVLLAIPLGLLCLLPRLTLAERTVWLWFSSLCIGALFFVGVPDSHVYTFFIPWALVVGAAVQEVTGGFAQRSPVVRGAAFAAGGLLIAVFAVYPWLIFSDAPAERLRQWDEKRPRAYWYPFAQPPARAIMGFPLRNGWKVAGALYAEGALGGSFESNARPEVADWYTRGQGLCPAPPRYYFLTTTVEPTDDEFLGRVRQEVENNYGLMGNAVVGGQEKMRMYAQGAEGAPVSHDVEEYAAVFDALTAAPMQSRRGRVLDVAPATPTDLRFGETIRLRGFTLPQLSVRPGESLPITLAWESVRPEYRSYTVFLHVVDPATNGKVGQTDALPVCGQNITGRWNPGDLIEDPQRIEIAPDAAPGRYRLYIGLYDVDTGARLPLLGPDGQPQADFADIAEIVVTE